MGAAQGHGRAAAGRRIQGAAGRVLCVMAASNGAAGRHPIAKRQRHPIPGGRRNASLHPLLAGRHGGGRVLLILNGGRAAPMPEQVLRFT